MASRIEPNEGGPHRGRATPEAVANGPAMSADPEVLMRTCPNCSSALIESRCKLLCPRCHYYMSCADYY